MTRPVYVALLATALLGGLSPFATARADNNRCAAECNRQGAKCQNQHGGGGCAEQVRACKANCKE